MRFRISYILIFVCLISCSEAEKFSLDSTNPLAMVGQLGWSYGLTPTENSPGQISGTQFVAVGDGCSSWVSDNGIDWNFSVTRFPGCDGGIIRSVVYGNGIWVAIGSVSDSENCGIWISQDDAATWNFRACATVTIGGVPVTKHLYAVGFGGGQFWAVGEHNSGGTGSDFFGQRSLDNGNSWSYFGIDDGSTYIASDYFYSISYSSATSEIYFSGEHSVNPEISEVSLPNLNRDSISIGMNSSKNRVLALSDGDLLVYGDNAFTSTSAVVKRVAASTTSPANTALFNAQAVSTAIQNHANGAVEGKDKILLVGDNCSMDYSALNQNVWHSGALSIGNCSATNLSAVSYNVSWDRYSVVGGSNFFAYSSTGLPGTWTAVHPDLGGVLPVPHPISVASKR
ncbi:hypothetical protein EHQ12_02380 [Leptospira gomenensis]|uniref:Galactose oxidase n=1 Tax=Leptospira gomenensis TaxID=2484974 RepID=A0A5F1YA63_9LEPT|nr:hypothetical protein [Leptospira gomenensis]TGK33719.1 hypothetical protein EHQ17_10465 [Leptospira gomenensis]TGK41962.1 hypothetical protein EHQ07_15105 [Leptospira gomenensis]TGK44216.1 hypothetical protein EHQ12_02380 [Leptospira gomenensis]TGK58004.1 hypothetical protein EHQ13_14665 [Leptospira gomenensis]